MRRLARREYTHGDAARAKRDYEFGFCLPSDSALNLCRQKRRARKRAADLKILDKSVFRQLWIDIRCPACDTACKIDHILETALLQQFRGALAASTGLAVNDNFTIAIEFVEAVGQIAERDQRSADVDDLIFVRFAYVEDEDIFSGIKASLQFKWGNLRDSVLHGRCFLCFLFGEDPAELLIVDQFLHRGVRAADRAVRVLAQFQLAELHVQRINEQKASDKRLTLAENELDH